MQEITQLENHVGSLLGLGLSRGTVSPQIMNLAKAYIENGVHEAYERASSGSSVSAEIALEPVLRALAHLSESERGGCLRDIARVFNGLAPSEYQLAKKVAVYAKEVLGDTAEAGIVATDVESLLMKEVTPQQRILGPWLVEKSITLVHAWRGTGKSLFTLSAALAIATGKEFLDWSAPHPRRVVIFDGEMPEAALQERVSRLIKANQAVPEQGYLTLSYLDIQPSRFLPNLALPAAQHAATEIIGSHDVVILDNLACLFQFGRENDAESWGPVRAWLLRLRALGKSVILVHHSGKNGKQRGTSAKEDIVDTVIGLRRPEGEDESSGALFELYFEKSRHFWGADADPFLARFNASGGGWSRNPISEGHGTHPEIQRLKASGVPQSEVARQLGLHRSTVSRNWR